LTNKTTGVVTVRIGGRDYSIRSDADPKYTRRCAEYVDNRMYDIGKELGPLEVEKLTILAALSITDGLFQMKEDEDTLSGQVTATIDAMVEQLEEVISEE
jgi:cell division protein ZapA (FtsZ GTPase activity inhibitor)